MEPRMNPDQRAWTKPKHEPLNMKPETLADETVFSLNGKIVTAAEAFVPVTDRKHLRVRPAATCPSRIRSAASKKSLKESMMDCPNKPFIWWEALTRP